MSPRILLVDDEPLASRAMSRIIGPKYEVDIAADCEDALNAIRDRGPYAVLIADMHMPDQGGKTLLQLSSALTPATQRILLTGYSDVNGTDLAHYDGRLCRVISKPYAVHTIRSILADAITEYTRTQQQAQSEEKHEEGSIAAMAADGVGRVVEADA